MNSKKAKRDPIPEEFKTLEEAGEFWDTHSAADYWDEMEDIKVDVQIKSRHYAIMLNDTAYHAARQLAQAEHLSPDEYINRLLQQELTRGKR